MVTHPFHPLHGQRLPVLKRRILDDVPMLQLQSGQDSVCMPESWTDRIPAVVSSAGVGSIPLLAPDALRELVELIAALQAPAKPE